MNDQAPSGLGWTIVLWIAQLLLAAAYGFFGLMKATQPLDQLAQMMTWIPDFTPAFVRTLGVVEMLGAVGLILPALTRIQPRLTVTGRAVHPDPSVHRRRTAPVQRRNRRAWPERCADRTCGIHLLGPPQQGSHCPARLSTVADGKAQVAIRSVKQLEPR